MVQNSHSCIYSIAVTSSKGTIHPDWNSIFFVVPLNPDFQDIVFTFISLQHGVHNESFLSLWLVWKSIEYNFQVDKTEYGGNIIAHRTLNHIQKVSIKLWLKSASSNMKCIRNLLRNH